MIAAFTELLVGRARLDRSFCFPKRNVCRTEVGLSDSLTGKPPYRGSQRYLRVPIYLF